MDNGVIKIYEQPDKLAKSLKKRFKSYKDLIIDNAPRHHWFPIVSLLKCHYVETYVKRCGNDCVDLSDFTVTLDTCDVNQSEPNNNNRGVKRKSSFDDLTKLYDENDELDYDDDHVTHYDTNYIESRLISGNDCEKSFKNVNNILKNSTKIEKINNNKTKFQRASDIYSDLLPAQNNRNNNNNDSAVTQQISKDFKIPKRVLSATNNKSLESIISHAKALPMTNAHKASEAFTYLNRYLSEEQWIDETVIKLLAGIALALASNVEVTAHIDQLITVLLKLKRGFYVESNFWDELIYSINSKSKKSQVSYKLNSLLASFYEYLLRHKIRARVECNEAVILAHRSVSMS